MVRNGLLNFNWNLSHNLIIFTIMFSETYFEVDLVNRLQTVIEKQRSQIKKLDQKVLDYKTDSEEVRRYFSLN